MEPLHSTLLAQSLNFHGQQLQKLWEAEYGENDLQRRNVKDLNFQVYSDRQKYLSFQERGKRLKLQQFVVKKANLLFTTDPADFDYVPEEGPISEDLYAIMPPFETYINVDKQNRLKHFFKNVKVGDLIIGTIVSKTQSGMMLKVLCTAGTLNISYVADINVKAFCPVANIIPAVDKKGITRNYMMNDSVCCEIIEKIPDSDKMVVCMKGTPRKPNEPERRPPLGLISADDFPLVYKKALEHKNESYDTVLEKSIGFNNPNNISYLSGVLGIKDHCTLMKGLKGRFPDNEYANELRQVQASKWAYRNVADGIDHFKAGNHVEAFQCLNKALNIDPKNVEGLVARGALYANSGNFQKAIADFETALKLNPNHGNARKYMGETLVALGRSYEEEDKVEEARKSYQSCLSLIPNHEEAQNSLKFLEKKAATTSKNLIEPNELLLPNITSSATNKSADVNDALKQLLKSEDEEKKDKKKKKKGKKRKNRRQSTSSSSSSSSGSNDSSSSSSSSSSESSSSSGDSDFKKRKKHRSRSHKREKQSSLSPLSKRMAMMDQSHDTPTNYTFNKPAGNALFDFNLEQPNEQSKSNNEMSYEQRLRMFLQETKGDSDYEEKVRKFLEESSKWKKEKRSDEKKKKKKKDRKAKKESKKKKKEKKLKKKSFDLSEFEDHKKLREALKKELSKGKKKKHSTHSDEDDYFLQKAGYTKRFIESLPDLEELESKLNAYYALEKESKRSELSESPKRGVHDSPSPTREQKARQAVAEAAASAGGSASSKWKMQVGSAPTTSSNSSSRFKKKSDREEWKDETVEKQSKNGDFTQSTPKKGTAAVPSPEKNMSVRKAMAMKEPPPKRPDSPKKPKTATPAIPPVKPLVNPGQVVLDKFGNFRLMTPPELKKGRQEEAPPLPPGRRPPEPPGRPRSNSKSPRGPHSRSRSPHGRKYTRSRSTSASRSRSRSYRSRSRSYYSRSRSRSGSYYSRSRSRSRSYSGDRRRYRRGGFRGRYNDRGTYYKPRFQNPRASIRGRGGGGGGGGGGGSYYSRDGGRYNDREFRGRGRPYNSYNNRGGRRPRGRYQRGGYRDYRDRRDYRSRSRDRSRSYSGSRERDSDEAVKKTNNENKEKLNKYIDNDGEPIKHDGPLSEGEDRDDYTSNDKYVDREAFDGKWAEKDDVNDGNNDDNRRRRGGGGGDGNAAADDDDGKNNKLDKDSIPPEDNIEEMDKFLSKVKKDKKEEMMERNKDLLKSKA